MYYNLFGKIKKYFNFSVKEILNIIVATVIFSFVISFRNWGTEAHGVDINYGLYTWLATGCIFFLYFTLYIAMVKCMAIWKGYLMNFDLNKFMLPVALFTALATNGFIALVIPGGHNFSLMRAHRLGKFKEMKYISFGYIGAIAGLVLVLIGALFAPWYGYGLIYEKLLIVPLLIAIFSLVPIANAPGFYLLLISFTSYFTISFVILVTALFAYLEAGFKLSLVVALFSGLFAWLLYERYLK